jgi:hypothetical protein
MADSGHEKKEVGTGLLGQPGARALGVSRLILTLQQL